MSEFHHPLHLLDDIDTDADQLQLFEALANNDLEDFQLALDMGADPLIPNNNGICVYEMCLSTYGRVEFVEKCLQNGCSPHHLNADLNKAAINYAADSKDPRIVDLILSHPNIMVNNTFGHLTPLNSLAVSVSNENINDVIECIERLIFYGASTTIPDDTGLTPAEHLMQNVKLSPLNKQKIMQELENFQKHKRLLINVELQDNNLQYGASAFSEIRPRAHIKINESEPICLSGLSADETENYTEEEWHRRYLFFNSIKHKDKISFDSIMAKGIDCNRKLSNQSPLECALESGNCHALKRLLARPETSITSVQCPLSLVIKNMKDDWGNYRKCLYMLLKNKQVDVNETDALGSTALHYAVDEHNNEAIVELLKRGAFLGTRNNSNILGIDGISPPLLKECFDSCILSHDILRVSLKYDNLRSLNQKEMPPLAFMAESEDHRHLLDHPLIMSFLQHKWNQLSFIFYLNFILFIFFAVSVMTYTILKFSTIQADSMVTAFRIMSWIGILYMIIREIIQVVTLPQQYFRFLANYLEFMLIVFAIINCKDLDIDRQQQKVIAVVTLLIIALELFLLCGCLPVLSMSTHMLMLEEVCKSFLKSFLLYSIFVVTFSFCFYILFGTEGQNAADGEGDFNKFTNPLKSVVKTVVMLTGEFDAGDLEFNTLFSYLLFLLFVFLMTIVLYNLLNGLAVSDIQTIMGQAKQNGTICRIELLTRYEEVVIDHFLHQRFIHLYKLANQSDDSNLHWQAPNDDIPPANRDALENALKILEQNKLISKRQQRLRHSENRFASIDIKLSNICKILDFKYSEKD